MSDSTAKLLVGAIVAVLFGPAILGNAIGLVLLVGGICLLALVGLPFLLLGKAYDKAKLKAARQAGRAVGRYQRSRQEHSMRSKPPSLIPEARASTPADA